MVLIKRDMQPPLAFSEPNRQQRRAQARADRKEQKIRTRVDALEQRIKESLPIKPGALPSPESQADKLALVQDFDGFHGLRAGLKHIGQKLGHWAGIPMPLDGHRLVIEPRYPHAEALSKMIGVRDRPSDHCDIGPNAKMRNIFYSHKMRCDICIYEDEGKVGWGWIPAVHHFKMDLDVMDCSVAWGIEQEHNALQLLGTLIRHHHLKTYLLTGAFAERSKRTGLTYVFRKLRPTVVLETRGDPSAEVNIKCCLCMHPIGYYEGSWAGAMCPTDDVIAHLMMMRGDEPRFWKLSNQIAAWRPEAGL